MKASLKILLIVCLCLVLSSCSLIDADFSRIESPTVSKTPINGKWIITKVIFTEDNEETSDIFSYKNYIGNDIYITEKGAIFRNRYIDDPSFKAKKVNLSRYLSKKFDISAKKLNISGENLVIVDIYQNDSFVYEVIKADEDKAFIYDNQNFIQINRVSNEINEEEYKEALKRVDPNSWSGL